MDRIFADYVYPLFQKHWLRTVEEMKTQIKNTDKKQSGLQSENIIHVSVEL